MCGRFANSAELKDIEKEFKINLSESESKPRYNIAPSQKIDVVLNQDDKTILTGLKWGLVPSWSKDPDIGNRMINARGETLSEKPSFREAFKKRRCIIPATGFYEWKKAAGGKQPYYFFLPDKPIFGFAGLYEEWTDKKTGELLETCTIITTEANDVLKPVHDRMPVVLNSENYMLWLDEKANDTNQLQKLIVPYSAKEMNAYPVSKSVNIPDVDSAELTKSISA
jgi:putative SOS response-associated peptidase YedK